jgi:hypothetical protein
MLVFVCVKTAMKVLHFYITIQFHDFGKKTNNLMILHEVQNFTPFQRVYSTSVLHVYTTVFIHARIILRLYLVLYVLCSLCI